MGAEPPRPGDGADPRDLDRGPAEEHLLVSTAQADRAARTYWEQAADGYQAEHGRFLAGDTPGGAFVWGPEGRTEAELRVLGPRGSLAGLRVLEVGCGAAQCSAWLASEGARPVGVDIALAQLRHARAGGVAPVPVVAGTATALPFGDGTFDCAFSAYGGVQFVAGLDLLLAEVRRVLRPGGRWAFSVTHPIRWAFPDDPSGAGLAVSTSYFDRTPYVERGSDGSVEYAELHRTLGDYVDALVRAGFRIDTLIEPEWPDWNDQEWGGWSPLRGHYLPGTLILGGGAPGPPRP